MLTSRCFHNLSKKLAREVLLRELRCPAVDWLVRLGNGKGSESEFLILAKNIKISKCSVEFRKYNFLIVISICSSKRHALKLLYKKNKKKIYVFLLLYVKI